MSSRAVIRKKARREAKRLKDAAAPPKKPFVHADHNLSSFAQSYSDSIHATGVSVAPLLPPAVPTLRVRRAMPRLVVEPPRPAQTVSEDSETETAVPREAEQPVSMEGLTHKQRKKLQTKLRLEKQMSRLQENAARAAASVERKQKDVSTEGEGEPLADGGEAPSLEVHETPKERHDPRFVNGTYWRDRKERRARTLFLGGVPSHFTVKHVKDFVTTIVDSDPGAVDYLTQLPEGAPVVEDVDMLNSKHAGKVKHMYVTMASVPIAFVASSKLDGMRMDQRSLRCNFAADKSQRAEAIRRRGPDFGEHAPLGGGAWRPA